MRALHIKPSRLHIERKTSMTPSPLKPSPVRKRRLSRKLGATLTELLNEVTPTHGEMVCFTGWTEKPQIELMTGAAIWDINDIHAAARLFMMSASEFLHEAGL